MYTYIHMYKQDLALNTLQELICCKIQPANIDLKKIKKKKKKISKNILNSPKKVYLIYITMQFYFWVQNFNSKEFSNK